jgi:hypothetical protein
VRLDDVRRAGRRADGPAEDHVVDEDEVGREALPHRRRVRLDPGRELLRRTVLHELHAVAVVAIEHEDRQQPADVGRTVAADPRS